MRGKAPAIIQKNSMKQDHPRLCGEKVLHIVQNFFIPGSPPPMRGKDAATKIVVDDGRITPAYAGKSSPDVPD